MGKLELKKLPGGASAGDDEALPMTMARPDATHVLADLEKAEAEKREQERKRKRETSCCFCGC